MVRSHSNISFSVPTYRVQELQISRIWTRRLCQANQNSGKNTQLLNVNFPLEPKILKLKFIPFSFHQPMTFLSAQFEVSIHNAVKATQIQPNKHNYKK